MSQLVEFDEFSTTLEVLCREKSKFTPRAHIFLRSLGTVNVYFSQSLTSKFLAE